MGLTLSLCDATNTGYVGYGKHIQMLTTVISDAKAIF
jgi:hypothetical protein